MKILTIGCLFLFALHPDANGKPMSKGRVEFHGYSDCIQLKNRNTRVILSGACGGRVLEYSLNGVNALYLNPAQAGWTYAPGEPTIDPSAGRLDIGPEHSMPKHPDFWVGKWKTVRTGAFSARMTSIADQTTGLQLVRDVVLDKNSSKLKITQTLINVSSKPVRAFHWSRTFVSPGGIGIVPLKPGSPMPLHHVMWEPRDHINFWPKDKRLVCVGDTLFITGLPRNPKIGISSKGTLAYITPQNLLFTKKFAVYDDRIYGELVPMNSCIYYAKKFCEIEPIGPQERIEPGGRASFTETWSLEEYPFPSGRKLDFEKLRALVE